MGDEETKTRNKIKLKRNLKKKLKKNKNKTNKNTRRGNHGTSTENLGGSVAVHLQRQKTQREDLSLNLHVRVLLRLLPPEGGPTAVGEEERHHQGKKEGRNGEKEKSNRGGAINDWLQDRRLR